MDQVGGIGAVQPVQDDTIGDGVAWPVSISRGREGSDQVLVIVDDHRRWKGCFLDLRRQPESRPGPPITGIPRRTRRSSNCGNRSFGILGLPAMRFRRSTLARPSGGCSAHAVQGRIRGEHPHGGTSG